MSEGVLFHRPADCLHEGCIKLQRRHHQSPAWLTVCVRNLNIHIILPSVISSSCCIELKYGVLNINWNLIRCWLFVWGVTYHWNKKGPYSFMYFQHKCSSNHKNHESVLENYIFFIITVTFSKAIELTELHEAICMKQLLFMNNWLL